MEEKITMHPKDQLFGVTEIYFDGDKITDSNPFGFSLEESSNINDGYVLDMGKEMFEAQLKIAEDAIKELLRPKDKYILTCTEIDDLRYTFSDGRDTIKIAFREVDDEIAKIKLGTTCTFKETLREKE